MTLLPFIISSLFTIFIWLYVHHNLKRNFINLFMLNTRWIWLFDFLFFYCVLSRLIYRIQGPVLNNPLFNLLINISYILLGFLGLLTLTFLLIDIKHLFEKFFYPKHVNEVDLSRRNFFKKNLALTGLATSTVISGVGYANSFDPKVKKVMIPLSGHHKNLAGLKIVQLSDIHIGPTLKKDFCEMLVARVNALNPDLIVITGDMVDGNVSYVKDELSPFSGFKSKLGTYYVTGNHEYYWNADEWIEWTKSAGMIPLINNNVKLNFNNADFYLAGVNDPYSKRLDSKNATDPKKAAIGIPADAYKILLAHQPTTCYQASKAGFHTQLSGHTHGGQGFPWNIIVTLVQPYVKGLNNHEGMNVYVHCGTGFWGPPNRFMVDSEIAEITFVKEDDLKTS